MTKEIKKLKLLYLARMFFEETDDEVGLTMPQIIERLEGLGVPAERKALYRDIKVLREFGMDIQTYYRAPVEYGLATRRFSQPELLLLTDAVQSSRFLTASKSDDLVRSIKTLDSKRQAKGLAKRLHVEGRIKMQNESVFKNLDAIQAAITAHRKVAFRYFRYGITKKQKLRHGGEMYVETPVQLMYSRDYYYLVVFNEKHDDFANYRIDRMLDIAVSSESAIKNERIATFDAAEYGARTFDMFSGSTVSATLLVEEEVMGALIDRFGRDVQVVPTDDGRAHVYVNVTDSPTFYGWVAQFGNKVRIVAPSPLVVGFTGYLQDMLAAYKED